MTSSSLTQFVKQLSREGLLLRVGEPVQADLELAEIARQLAARHDGAVLFEQVADSELPVLANALASEATIVRLLGVGSYDEFAARFEMLDTHRQRRGWIERLKSAPPVESLLEQFAPKSVKVGACQQVVLLGRDVNLHRLPIPRAWPAESRRAIHGARLVYARPRGGGRAETNAVGIVASENQLALVDSAEQHIFAALRAAGERGERLPVAVVLGGDPLANVLARLAEFHVFGDLDIESLCGLLRETPQELVAGRTQPVEVPAEAELVLEGVVDPDTPAVASGVFAAASGHYHERVECPVMQVTAITRRKDAIFPYVGGDGRSHEAAALRELAARMLLADLKRTTPEIVDLAFLPRAGHNQGLVVAIDKSYAGQGRKVAGAVWAHDGLMRVGMITVVDRHVPVRDTKEVMFCVAANVRPAGDLFRQQGPSDPLSGCGLEKWGLDATAKWPGEAQIAWPQELSADRRVQREIAARWGALGLPPVGE
ncbi:MAG: UbiD family decarboxylase [Planctomycetales bacterium]|nr:UbiD family decarboxylase [Planctomycetales bacterium]